MWGLETLKKIKYGKRLTIPDSADWIHGAKAPQDSVPCKITFNMQGFIYLAHPWINLDSLLMHCVLQEVLGEKIVDLPNKDPIDLSGIELPIKTLLGVNHTSISFFDDEIKVLDSTDFNIDTVYKRFEGKDTAYLKRNKNKGKIRKGSGKFKSYAMKLPYISPGTVTFFAHGNIEGLKYLLRHVHCLGLKRSINALNVKSLKIKEIEEDKSLVYQGKAMRPLPCKKYGAGQNNVNMPYFPPYWDKRNIEMCIFPCSDIIMFNGGN